MITPTFTYEHQLHRRGYQYIAGIDESGRGPLAGPVVAAAVQVKSLKKDLRGVRDSKTLTPKKREELYQIITTHPSIDWGIGIVSEKLIDRINILQATFVAMKQAAEQLKHSPDFLLLDGRFTLRDFRIDQRAIPDGDKRIFSIAAASIIAKVTRDRIMLQFHKKYPLYSFDRHKGYGTRLHFEMLERHGPCDIHRQTFKPVAKLVGV